METTDKMLNPEKKTPHVLLITISLFLIIGSIWAWSGGQKESTQKQIDDPFIASLADDLDNPPKSDIIETEESSESENTFVLPPPADQPKVADENNFKETPSEISLVNQHKKQVVFTFDGGSGSQSAQGILDNLDRFDITSTFFLTGDWINDNQNLVRQIINRHEIFNHTYNHSHLTQLTDDQIVTELSDTENLLKNLFGVSTKPYFRPPYGERNQHILDVAAGEGYRSVYWTVDALDWKESEGMTKDEVVNRILDNLKPGAIYLMHIGDNLTAQVLPEVIPQIRNQGFAIVSLSKGME